MYRGMLAISREAKVAKTEISILREDTATRGEKKCVHNYAHGSAFFKGSQILRTIFRRWLLG